MWLITSALGSTGSLIVILSEILIVFLAFGVKEKYLKYLFCLSVVYLAWLAYHFEPTSGNDLLYHFRMIEFAKNAGWAGLVVHYQLFHQQTTFCSLAAGIGSVYCLWGDVLYCI